MKIAIEAFLFTIVAQSPLSICRPALLYRVGGLRRGALTRALLVSTPVRTCLAQATLVGLRLGKGRSVDVNKDRLRKVPVFKMVGIFNS